MKRTRTSQLISQRRPGWFAAITTLILMMGAILIPVAAGGENAGVADAEVAVGDMPAGVVFAPDTDPNYAGEVLGELFTAQGLIPEPLQFTTHWDPSMTALNNGGASQGDAIELTWSIIPDGTLMPSQGLFDTACTSNLIATLDTVYGAGLWQTEIQNVWNNWTNNTANVYTPAVALDANGTPIDDGATWPSSLGVPGVRGDVRIGGCTIDGNLGILAYNFFPSNGDMKIDVPDSFYALNPLSPHFHNVFSHEHGHGAGLAHVCPTDNTKLMEPLVNTNFIGLQHDDLRGVQRGYGDRFEVIGSSNDSMGTATPLTPRGGQTEALLSLDSTADEDWFSFSADSGDVLNVTVTPTGASYLEGPDPLSDLCVGATPTLIDSQALQDLAFEVRDSTGVLTTIDATGAGFAETTTGFSITNTGTYYVRVRGAGTNDTQLYDIDVALVGVGGGALCNGKTPTLLVPPGGADFFGTTGNDVILGTSGADRVFGLGGSDDICGEADGAMVGGDDNLNGGNGADNIFGGPGNDFVGGQGGLDMLFGGPGNDEIAGGIGNDVMRGGDGEDTMRGQGNDDQIFGEGDVDTIFGGSGNDTIETGLGGNLGTAHVVTGNGNNDVITGSPDADVLDGQNGLDTIFGGGGNDTLTGGLGFDRLNGGDGNDLLEGFGSRDILHGDGDDDVMNGGAGDDDLYGDAGANDVCNGGPGTDATPDVSCETITGVP